MRRFAAFASKRLKERGSALLVSLMVMVGLSLLGLAFVAVSQSESAISMNQRNHTQTLQFAEAGAQRVVDWFQNPEWALQQGLMPANVDSIKVTRKIAVPGSSPVTYVDGKYKNGADDILFDKPFRPNMEDRFYGTENNPDILINDTTTGAGAGLAANFLRNFNIRLFNNDPALTTIDNSENIAITEIRIYAPPIDGSTVNTQPGWTAAASGFPTAQSGFHEGGSRFGVATIKVTATKYDRSPSDPAKEIIAQRSVKASISVYPFPGPQGPIQSNANIDTNGNYKVHWGKITAEGTIELKRPFVGINYVDAYNRVHFERGYDDVMWPVDPASPFKDKYKWLWELIGREYEDPWYEARARGTLGQAPGGTPPPPHPFKYTNQALIPSLPICNPCNKASDAGSPGQSNFFQDQNQSVSPPSDYREVIFPRIDYAFWKNLAIAADDQPNIYYLQWDNPASGGKGGQYYKDRSGHVRDFNDWVNVTAAPPAGTGPKSVAGFYFFETRNNLNPQNAGGGVLAPEVSIAGGGMQMQGFIYVNASMKLTGSGKTWEYYYNMPGEVYRDIGIVRVEEDPSKPEFPRGYAWNGTTPDPPCNPATREQCFVDYEANNEWNYQDLAISHGGTSKNGVFDYVVRQQTGRVRNSPLTMKVGNFTIPDADSWFIVPYNSDTTICPVVGVDCSEPHEPYLNFIYPDTRDNEVTVRWHNPGVATGRKAKEAIGAVPVGQTGYSIGVKAPCVAENTLAAPTDPATIKAVKEDRARCTSNAYDRDGGLVNIDPILDGVLYMEGDFPDAGNMRFFGSILIQGSVGATGTPDVYFDEKLVKGDWPPGRFGFPRVYISSLQTD